MNSILITRESRLWINRFRSYKILIDNKVVGTLTDGESKEFSVTPGEHSIQAKIDWGTSPRLCISGDQSMLKLHCGTNANPITALFYAIAGWGNYLWLSRDD